MLELFGFGPDMSGWTYAERMGGILLIAGLVLLFSRISSNRR